MGCVKCGVCEGWECGMCEGWECVCKGEGVLGVHHFSPATHLLDLT